MERGDRRTDGDADGDRGRLLDAAESGLEDRQVALVTRGVKEPAEPAHQAFMGE